MLVLAKKMGLSFDELNLFSVDDYMAFIDAWTDNGKDEGGTVRMATQEDIDRMLG